MQPNRYLFFQWGRALWRSLASAAPTARCDLGLGALGGALAAVLTHPIDVAKTRLMTQPAGAEKYHGLLPTLAKLVAEEGPGVLFTGIVPRLLYLSPLAAIILATYEAVSRRLLQGKQRKADLEAAAAAVE